MYSMYIHLHLYNQLIFNDNHLKVTYYIIMLTLLKVIFLPIPINSILRMNLLIWFHVNNIQGPDLRLCNWTVSAFEWWALCLKSGPGKDGNLKVGNQATNFQEAREGWGWGGDVLILIDFNVICLFCYFAGIKIRFKWECFHDFLYIQLTSCCWISFIQKTSLLTFPGPLHCLSSAPISGEVFTQQSSFSTYLLSLNQSLW